MVHKQILVKYNSYTITLVTRDGAVLSQLSITLDALWHIDKPRAFSAALRLRRRYANFK